MNMKLLVAGLIPVFVMAMLLFGQAHRTYKAGVLIAIAILTIPIGLILVAAQFGIFELPPSAAIMLVLYCVIVNPCLLLGGLTLIFKGKIKRP